PQEAAREPPQAGLRAALAGGERLLPTQAVARLGAARQVGCVPRARVLPPRAHSQPDAPRSHGVEGFNRASGWFNSPCQPGWTQCPLVGATGSSYLPSEMLNSCDLTRLTSSLDSPTAASDPQWTKCPPAEWPGDGCGLVSQTRPRRDCGAPGNRSLPGALDRRQVQNRWTAP